ncbi:hypothetical protein [Methanospirillum lacunae]|nr:hypothetical protein [Methanospirillum lacunae]
MHYLLQSIRAWDGKNINDLMDLLRAAWEHPDITPNDIWGIRMDNGISDRWKGRVPHARMERLEKKWPHGVIAMDASDKILVAHSYTNSGELYLIDNPHNGSWAAVLVVMVVGLFIAPFLIFPQLITWIMGVIVIGFWAFLFIGGILVSLMIFDGITR